MPGSPADRQALSACLVRLRDGAMAVLRALDLVSGRLAELLAAALVVIEVAILLGGVVFRYVLDNPLVWTDELAEMLFLWLISLGAVIALRRAEHMSMSFLTDRLGPRPRALLARFASLCALVFIGIVAGPGLAYMRQQQAITTPALHIPGSWQIAGELFAFALMLVCATYKFLAGARPLELAIVLAAAGLVGGGFWLLEPWLQAIDNGSLVIFFVGMVSLCIFCGVPIVFSFGIATAAYIFYTSTIPLTIIISQMNQGMSAIELLAVPMFVVLGLLLDMTGLARALINLLNALVGHRRGGLSYALIGAMYLISGISGSKAADQAAIAPVLVPEMKRRGGHPGDLVALLAASAAMSETIPPSLVLIIVGAVTGVSTAALFSGGLLPASVAALCLVLLVAFKSRKDAHNGERAGWRKTGRLFIIALPALILPILIRYAVLEGITTATEVATIGVGYTVIVGLLIYRQFDWRRLYPILTETAALSGAILMIIGTASTMAWALTQAGFADTLTSFMTTLPGGKASFLAISCLLFVVLGSVLEGLPAMVLFGPLLFPIAQQLDINVVQYAIVAILAMGIGLFSPPFGVGFYQSCLITRARPDQAILKIWPYMGVLVIALILVATVPWLSTGLAH
ncbi:TRAP transporter large permease subunit [Acidocella sp.]|uniref:TRAP transporter large permease n=1 Tax=Acidocella sp. TaxID=50710 RepID=UPI002624AE23|nr:TRAP transporter large permease subunit [Acidocella sp.]